MNLLERAATWLRGVLGQQSWLDDWQPAIAATPDWALLAAGPTALVLLALMLRTSWPERRKANASANINSRRVTEPPHRTKPVASALVPDVLPKTRAASAAGDEDNRSVRIFVSSTFLDMKTERHELVTKVFPALREKYRARGVEVFEVDLRWGITREQQKRGETLPTLLAEIDRCRPYFIGLLGDRFGWVPPSEALTTKLKADYPAIAEAEGMSITAMEIMHGVLSNPETAARAVFFERDLNWDWMETLDDADRAAAAAETDIARAKLAELKAQVRRKARLEVYARPKEIGEKVTDALDAILEARFPEAQAPDAFEQAARLHSAYARERRVLHVGAAKYLNELDRWMEKSDAAPILITGASGGGKSALIANWLGAWRRAHPVDIVFEHYLGASPDSADPLLLMRRLWEHLNRVTRETVDLPEASANLMDVSSALAQRLARAHTVAAQSGARLIVALDGLDKLSSEQSLRWLPLTPGVRVLASSLDGEAMSAVLARGFADLEVKPLTDKERLDFIQGTLARWRRSLDPDNVERIMKPAAAELSGSPLYLKTVLEELRVSADHARLAARLETYRGATDMPDLFDRVLARLEDDCEPGLVAKSLPLIWASRAGLEEAEVIAITGATPLAWSMLRNGLGDAMRDQAGRMAFGHDHLSKAAERRYIKTKEEKRAAHIAIADRFAELGPNARQTEELPYQLRAAEAWGRLEELLTDLDRFESLRARGDRELASYWMPLAALGKEPEQLLLDKMEQTRSLDAAQWTAEDSLLASALFGFLTFVGARSDRCLALGTGICDADIRLLSPPPNEEARAMIERLFLQNWNQVVVFVAQRGDYEAAANIQEQLVARLASILAEDHRDMLSAKRTYATILYNLSDYARAKQIIDELLTVEARVCDENCDRLSGMLSSLQLLATILVGLGRNDEAVPVLERALGTRLRVFGEDLETASMMLSLEGALIGPDAKNLSLGNRLLQHALNICLRTVGPKHPITRRCKAGLIMRRAAFLEVVKNEPGEAKQLLERQVAELADDLGADHQESVSARADLEALQQRMAE